VSDDHTDIKTDKVFIVIPTFIILIFMPKQIHVEQARSITTYDLEHRIMQLLNAFPTWRFITTTFIGANMEYVNGNLTEVQYFWMIFEEEMD
jgi:hypothetical protein